MLDGVVWAVEEELSEEDAVVGELCALSGSWVSEESDCVCVVCPSPSSFAPVPLSSLSATPWLVDYRITTIWIGSRLRMNDGDLTLFPESSLSRR